MRLRFVPAALLGGGLFLLTGLGVVWLARAHAELSAGNFIRAALDEASAGASARLLELAGGVERAVTESAAAGPFASLERIDWSDPAAFPPFVTVAADLAVRHRLDFLDVALPDGRLLSCHPDAGRIGLSDPELPSLAARLGGRARVALRQEGLTIEAAGRSPGSAGAWLLGGIRLDPALFAGEGRLSPVRIGLVASDGSDRPVGGEPGVREIVLRDVDGRPVGTLRLELSWPVYRYPWNTAVAAVGLASFLFMLALIPCLWLAARPSRGRP